MTDETKRSDGNSDSEDLKRALEAIHTEIRGIRDRIDGSDVIMSRLKKDNIAGLFTRAELVLHELYAFKNLINFRVRHMSEGPQKMNWKDPAESECIIYGSNLKFIQREEFRSTAGMTDGIRLGLMNGINFRLSILSPLPDSHDSPEVREIRHQAARMIDFFVGVKQDATKNNWPGGFLLSAAPRLTNDSFSSIKIACDRRVSVLAATRHSYVAEYIFDEVSPEAESAASQLLKDYQKNYKNETFPVMFYNWYEITEEELSVRVIVFADKDTIVQNPQSSDQPWVSWEFGWAEIRTTRDILTNKIKHYEGIPSYLRNEPLREIVFGGNCYQSHGSQEIYFFANLARKKSRSTKGGANKHTASLSFNDVAKEFPQEILTRLEVYRSGIY
jgi:hypothetical protein